MSRHEVSAGKSPCGSQQGENHPSDHVPFATIHVRVSKPAGYQYGDCPNGDETRNEYVYDVLDGFERVLKVTRHKSFLDYFEVWGGLFTNLAFLSLGVWFGLYVQFL